METYLKHWIDARMPANPRFKLDKKFLPDLRLARIFESSDQPFIIKHIDDKGEPLLVLKDPPRGHVHYLD